MFADNSYDAHFTRRLLFGYMYIHIIHGDNSLGIHTLDGVAIWISFLYNHFTK